jgi:hypothetical protein
MNDKTDRRRRAGLAALCAVASLAFFMALSGCGGGSSLPQETLDRARQSIETALDVWKKGGSPAQLGSLSPPIVMTDPDWNPKAGQRLLDYEIKKVEGKQGEYARCWVKLSLQSRQGKKADRDAVYEVSVGPKILIGRDAFN